MYASLHVVVSHKEQATSFELVANRVVIDKLETTIWLDSADSDEGQSVSAGRLVVDRAHFDVEITANY